MYVSHRPWCVAHRCRGSQHRAVVGNRTCTRCPAYVLPALRERPAPSRSRHRAAEAIGSAVPPRRHTAKSAPARPMESGCEPIKSRRGFFSSVRCEEHAHRTSGAVPARLADYRPPDWLVQTVHLDVACSTPPAPGCAPGSSSGPIRRPRRPRRRRARRRRAGAAVRSPSTARRWRRTPSLRRPNVSPSCSRPTGALRAGDRDRAQTLPPTPS